MKILVTGSSGQLGRELQLTLGGIGQIAAVGSAQCDICCRADVERTVAEAAPDVIINCAAYTAVDRAESEHDAADRVNRTGAANLARAAAGHDAALIHISTDYVFDGLKGSPYTEQDAAAPINYYGLSKLRGEEEIRSSGCRGIILRTQWLYSPFGHNFLKTMLQLGRSRSEIKVVNDQYGSPTAAADLAAAIAAILPHTVADRSMHGEIFHYAAAGSATWYDFAVEIFRLARIDCHVRPIATAAYPAAACRPACSLLATGKLRERFGIVPPDWRDGLARCLRRIETEH